MREKRGKKGREESGRRREFTGEGKEGQRGNKRRERERENKGGFSF